MIKFKEAPDVHQIVREIVEGLGWDHIPPDQVVCYRSNGTKSDCVHARCWSLPRIWQSALQVKPHYIVEVISEKYDEMNDAEKRKLLIHELLHIPKSFAGGLRPHTGYINKRIVDGLYEELKSNTQKKDDLGIRFF